MATKNPGFAPTVPGVTKSESPTSGKDMMGDMIAQMAGKMPGPRQSAGDKVAQAVQLLREAAQQDLRIAPLVNGAIQALITGSPASPGSPADPASPMVGPNTQSAGGPAALGALAAMMPARQG